MTQQDISDAHLARARIDGGFSFALAAFAIGLGLLAVLERIGLPDRALEFCVGAMIFSGFVTIAGLMRTMRPVDFYAGGRSLPAAYAGLACAGLAAGLFLPFLPPLPQSIGLNSIAWGFCAGLCCALFATGPYLRRRAAFSIADLVGSRFPHPVVRYATAGLAAVTAGLVALAGYAIALHAFVAVTDASRAFGAAVLGLLLVFLVVPGGLSGVIWLAVGAAVVALTALGLPPALSILGEAPLWAAGAARFDAVTGAQPNLPLAPAVVITLMLGLAALAPLFGPVVASRDRGTALRSGIFALAFAAVIAVLAVLTLARATLALDAILVGQDPSQVPAAILTASAEGDVTLCGVQSGKRVVVAGSCAEEAGFDGVLRLQDIGAESGYLLENLPVLRHAGPTLAALAAVFAIALGIALAAAGAQSFATSLGHDIFHPKRRRFGPASRRLAFARMLAILIVVFCGARLAHRAADPRIFIALALTISATLVAPLIGLTLIKRANSLDALVALLVAAVVMGHFLFVHPHGLPPAGLATNAIFAALDSFFAGLFVSFLHGGRPQALPTPPPTDEPFGPD